MDASKESHLMETAISTFSAEYIYNETRATMTKRPFSHTSLALWRLCHRRFYNRYVLGQREPTGLAAAYSTHMVHGVLEDAVAGNTPDLEAHWLDYQKEAGDEFNPDHILLTMGTSRDILDRYRASPVEGEPSRIEEFNQYVFSTNGESYISKPDFIVHSRGRRHTVDFKFATSNWPSAKRPWVLDPLSAFNDQLLGQAICAKADGFIRVTFQGDRKSGHVHGPIIEEKLVDAALAQEWLAETVATIDEIVSWGKRTHVTYPKNDNSCKAFGRVCPYLASCAQATPLTNVSEAIKVV